MNPATTNGPSLGRSISALLAEEYLEERARRGSRDKYERALAQVPDAEPDERDGIE